MELKGLSRKKLLEHIFEDSPVYTSNPESQVAEEHVSRIYPSTSNSKPQSSPDDIYRTPYAEPVKGERIMSATTTLSSPGHHFPLLGPSNTVSSLYPAALCRQTTSAFSPTMDPPQAIWDSQFGQQMVNPSNYYPTTCTGDHLDTYLRDDFTPIPLSVGMEAHPQNALYQIPLWEHHRHPRTSSGPPLSSTEPYLDALHSSTTGYANQNEWCSRRRS